MLATVRALKAPVLSSGARALSVPAFVPDLKAQTAKPKVRSGRWRWRWLWRRLWRRRKG